MATIQHSKPRCPPRASTPLLARDRVHAAIRGRGFAGFPLRVRVDAVLPHRIRTGRRWGVLASWPASLALTTERLIDGALRSILSDDFKRHTLICLSGSFSTAVSDRTWVMLIGCRLAGSRLPRGFSRQRVSHDVVEALGMTAGVPRHRPSIQWRCTARRGPVTHFIQLRRGRRSVRRRLPQACFAGDYCTPRDSRTDQRCPEQSKKSNTEKRFKIYKILGGACRSEMTSNCGECLNTQMEARR